MKTDPVLTHLLVDLNGTLLGAHDLPLRIHFTAKAIAEIRRHGGWIKSIQALRAIQHELRRPSTHHTNDERAARVLEQHLGLPVQKAKQELNQIADLLFPEMERYFFPIQGAHDFLSWAKDHFHMILATNPIWTEEIIKLRLKWAGIQPSWFQSITHSKRMHACKPCQEYYNEILDQESLSPDSCLLVGNDPKMDLPAVATGIPVFIVSKSKKIQSVRFKNQKARAWQGSFHHLKTLLEQPLKTSSEFKIK